MNTTFLHPSRCQFVFLEDVKSVSFQAMDRALMVIKTSLSTMKLHQRWLHLHIGQITNKEIIVGRKFT